MNDKAQPLLLVNFIKFILVFMVIYYPLTWVFAKALDFKFMNSIGMLGSKANLLTVFYLVGIQMTGISFGFIGYGAAAINREYGTSPMSSNIYKFMSRGPFQRGIPSREAAGILFCCFFILGSVPMSFAAGIVLELAPELFVSWLGKVGAGTGLIGECPKLS